MFSPNPSARSAHASQTPATIGGGSYHKWILTFALTEGCAAEAVGSIELETPLATSTPPLGTITLRAAQDSIDTTPSAYLSYMGATLVSGTVTVDSADDYLTGSMTAQVTIAGAPTEITATFNAPVCR